MSVLVNRLLRSDILLLCRISSINSVFRYPQDKNCSSREYSKIVTKPGKQYRWNDILFASSFNEIVKVDTTTSDLSQYSIFREKNFVKSFDKGLFSLLPFVVRAYERLVELVDHELQSVGCQKIIMPALVGKHLWMKSERWDNSGEEILRVMDRNKQIYCLAPTQEETVTQILASVKQLSFRNLPLYLYQITPKYRDELRTKYGLLRAREFIMKDLYTFDRDEDAAKITYDKIMQTYKRIFDKLELPVVDTVGSTGSMGGKYSHEWLLKTDLGEDELYTCLNCNESFNAELINEVENDSDIHCLNCKSDQLVPKIKALELGHCFLLSDRYSSKMNANYYPENSAKPLPLQMGCYGLGLSRIIASSVEYLSAELPENIQIRTARGIDFDENDDGQTHIRNNIISLRWPKLIVPFKICLILPKKGSKEDHGKGTEFSLHLTNVINQRFGEDVLIDDRSSLTVGKRLLTAKAIGIPFVIIAGRNVIDDVPKFELFHTYDDDFRLSIGIDKPQSTKPLLLTQLQLLNLLEDCLPQYQLMYNDQ